MAAPFALARTPMYDAQGNMTRPWLLYFNGLAAPAGGGGAGGITGPVYTIPNTGNIFVPDFSQGLLQYVLLIADSQLAPSVNGTPGTFWILIIDQDATGGHNLQLDPSYFFKSNILGLAALSTRSQSQWLCDAAGKNSLSGAPSTDQPIPS